MSRKVGTGFVPYVLTSSSKNPDDGNGTLAGGPSKWYKDFRLAHGKFFDWDPESEVSLHRKLRAAELGIGSQRAVLFGVAEDINNRKAVLSSWTPAAAAVGKKRRMLLLDAAAAADAAADERDEALVDARDKMAERSVTSAMRALTPQKGDKHRAYVHGISTPALPAAVKAALKEQAKLDGGVQ